MPRISSAACAVLSLYLFAACGTDRAGPANSGELPQDGGASPSASNSPSSSPSSPGADGGSSSADCIPISCSDQAATCGTATDGCGSSLDCGTCPAPLTCGGSGLQNRCGCMPSTCAELGKDCGSVSDGCGGFLDCGTCAQGLNCGGGGAPNVCGEGICTPLTCEAEGKDCDLIADGCGNTLNCGDCSPPSTCGGSGQPNVCGCSATTCAAQGKNCGTILDGCGGELDCGSCATGQTCGGGGEPNMCGIGTCTPETCASKGRNCGTTSDGCGAILTCGTCTLPETCGGGGVEDVCGVDQLEAVTGCAGVYNVDQVLDFHLTMAAGDWQTVKGDMTNSVYRPAQFRCGSEPALAFDVGIRRKRSGSTEKPGLKVDFNYYDPEAAFYSVKKISLENGISEGSGDLAIKDIVTEYLAWRFMQRGGAISSRAAFIRLFINGTFIGVYTNVEQVDKRFLRSRLADESGWLYKHSGSTGDGYKTNTTQPNPYATYLCFWEANPCAAPSAAQLETYLPEHLDIPQMLKFGGINALLANSDAPFVKRNNYYFYDWHYGGRIYLPWDLDTVMNSSPPLFGGTGTTLFTSVLFSHWEDDYDTLLTNLLQGPLSIAGVEEELARVVRVAAAALDADPVAQGDSTADVIASVRTWWSARHAQLVTELAAH